MNSGVADARKVMDGARGGLFRTVLFVDEVHRWSKAQQDVLLPAVEEGTVTLIGATTENPYFSLNTPLLSRCLLLRLEPLDDEAVAVPARAGARRRRSGSDARGLDRRRRAGHLVTIAGGDARMALTGLEAAAEAHPGRRHDRDHAGDRRRRRAEEGDRLRPTGRRPLRRDQRVHQVDPGSDPDAALFWLARMIEAGEDPRFIARRLIVHASEDIGMADSNALVVAVAAAQAVEHVGLPEVRLNLAHATVYLATAPKSNSIYTAIAAAFEDAPVRRARATAPSRRELPRAKRLGHGEGYRYPPTTSRGIRWSSSIGRRACRTAATTSRRAREDVEREPGTGRRTDPGRAWARLPAWQMGRVG